MSIRPAQVSDIAAMVGILEHAYSESLYVEYGAFDPRETQKVLMQAIQLMGHKSKQATLVWVSETHGVVSGLIVGALQPVYLIGSMLTASEVYWYGNRTIAEPRDIAALFLRFQTWAEKNERVVEIKSASFDAVMHGKNGGPTWREAAPFFQRRGFEEAGTIFVKRIKR